MVTTGTEGTAKAVAQQNALSYAHARSAEVHTNNAKVVGDGISPEEYEDDEGWLLSHHVRSRHPLARLKPFTACSYSY